MSLDNGPLFGFKPGGPSTELLACLNFVDDHMGGAAKGYRQAAELLTQCLGDRKGDLDFLVYPIVFLWRHYLELELKVLRQALQGKGDLHHKLILLWQECRSLLERHVCSPDSGDLDKIEGRIREFQDIDPDSMAFRYTKHKKTGRSIVPGKHIDLGRLFNLMREIADQLEEWVECAEGG